MAPLVHQLLEDSARRTPDAVAVADRGRTIDYATLERQANRLAHLLLGLGVARGDRVGLYLTKSLESVIAVYGVLKAGATYVPLDPNAPVLRLAHITSDCGITRLLTGREQSVKWAGLRAHGSPVEQLVVLDVAETHDLVAPEGIELLGARSLEDRPDVPPDVRTIGFDTAYILYTSGSTGSPKGVMLSHGNCMAFLDWAVAEFHVGPGDRLSSHAPLHFDLSTFDVFAAAHAGASVHLVPPEISGLPIEIARFMEREAITVWYSVPSILTLLRLRGGLRGGDLRRLHTILFAGEVFPTRHLRDLMSLLPHVRFCNLYGPTETNVCTWYDLPPLPPDMVDPIPIGSAIAGVELLAVAANGREAGDGELGELWVRGPTVMQGYWNDPVRTARSLATNPTRPHLPDPLYRTGDLARRGPDGNWHLVGRRDLQIKSRGYRIELGEIETVLNANPVVRECAVIAVPDDVFTNRIEAMVVTQGEVSASDLVKFCSERLPRYMIPEAFHSLGQLPRTSTGKVDRQALIESRAADKSGHASRASPS